MARLLKEPKETKPLVSAGSGAITGGAGEWRVGDGGEAGVAVVLCVGGGVWRAAGV